MVGGTQFSGDKSHKNCKYVHQSSQDGESVRAFEGIYTVYNEFRQVTGQWLCQTGSMDEIKLCLAGLARRFELRGWTGPLTWATDVCCFEREMLGRIFPSLFSPLPSENGEDGGDGQQLPSLELPAGKFTRGSVYLKDHQGVDAFIGELNRRANDDGAQKLTHVGLDCEWPLPWRSKVATLQLATSDGAACVIQLSKLSTIPDSLKNFLARPDVAKVGKNIGNDVKRLRDHDLHVAAVIDVAHAAKAAARVVSAQISLAELVRQLLSKRLAGKADLRTQTAWDGELSDEQLKYAAVDAYAGALLLDEVKSGTQGVRSAAPAAGELHADDLICILAQGCRSVAALARVVRTDNELLVVRIVQLCSAVAKLPRTQRNQTVAADTVGAAAAANLEIDWKLSNVRSVQPIHRDELEAAQREFAANSTLVDRRGRTCVLAGVDLRFDGLSCLGAFVRFTVSGSEQIVRERPADVRRWSMSGAASTAQPLPSSGQAASCAMPDRRSSAELLDGLLPRDTAMDDYDDAGEGVEAVREDEHVHGEESLAELEAAAGELWAQNRIKLDALHAMMRIERTLKKKHGCYALFMSRLRDAIFITDDDDMEAIRTHLRVRSFERKLLQWRQSRPPGAQPSAVERRKLQQEADEVVAEREKHNYAFFMRRVRRSIPPPAELEERVRRAVDLCATVKDAATGSMLFTRQTWTTVDNLIRHIRRGCLSDCPDVNYYYIVGRTRDGMPRYRCTRGTSPLEGYHRHLHDLAAQQNMSPSLFVAILRVFNYRWNINQAVANGLIAKCYGDWYGHERIERMQTHTADWPTGRAYADWVSTADYESTGETFYLPAGVHVDGLRTAEHESDDEDERAIPEVGDGCALPVVRAADLPVRKVDSAFEKEFFEKEWAQFRGGANGESQFNSIDFSKFAEHWNAAAAAPPAAADAGILFGKTPALLRQFWTERARQLNVASTLAAPAPFGLAPTVFHGARELSAQHRLPCSAPLPQPAQPLPSAAQCASTSAPQGGAPPGAQVFPLPLSALGASAAVGLSSMPAAVAGCAIPPPANMGLGGRQTAASRGLHAGGGRARENPMCRRCGNLHSAFPELHKKGVAKSSKAYCTVSPEDYAQVNGQAWATPADYACSE